MTFLMILFVILLYMMMILLSTPSVKRHLELASELDPDLVDSEDHDRKWLVDFNAGSSINIYLKKFTIQTCMEYSCHVWAGAPSCYLDILDKIWKQVCRIFRATLAASLEPLGHRRNLASLSLFYRYYFGRC